jgi:hypothetical protein
MGKLISLVATLAVLASLTGQLPSIIHKVQLAQLYLIKDSQASKWPKAMTLPSR